MTKRTTHSYYVVMQDFGKPGLEAIVHPEDTRRDIIDKIVNGDIEHVVFIHRVDDLMIDDVTDEMMDEVEHICSMRDAG